MGFMTGAVGGGGAASGTAASTAATSAAPSVAAGLSTAGDSMMANNAPAFSAEGAVSPQMTEKSTLGSSPTKSGVNVKKGFETVKQVAPGSGESAPDQPSGFTPFNTEEQGQNSQYNDLMAYLAKQGS